MEDLQGKKFGRLTFFGLSESIRKSIFLCDCGVKKEFFRSNVTTGKSLSCGCLSKEQREKRFTKHGAAKRGQHSRAYNTWGNMLGRCYKTYREDYKRYGGRGIKVCDQWKTFSTFLADMGEPAPGMTLDRIDNNANYEPGNCKWSSSKEQANNRRSNVLIEHEGRTQNIEAWANELGIKRGTIESRINRGATSSYKILAPTK